MLSAAAQLLLIERLLAVLTLILRLFEQAALESGRSLPRAIARVAIVNFVAQLERLRASAPSAPAVETAAACPSRAVRRARGRPARNTPRPIPSSPGGPTDERPARPPSAAPERSKRHPAVRLSLA